MWCRHFKDTIFLKTNDPTLPLVSLLVEGNVESTISITPQKLALGGVTQGDLLTRRVVIRAQKPFQILAVDGTGQGVELAGELSAQPASVQTVALKIQIPGPGEFRREIRIRTSLQEAPLVLAIDGMAAP